MVEQILAMRKRDEDVVFPNAAGINVGASSVPELVSAIDEYVAHHSTDPKPFIWTKSARDILQKVIRANSRLSSKQNATLH